MRVLIVKLNAIGDVLFATPLLEALRRRDPSGQVDWLVAHHAEPILRGHPSLQERILYDGPYGRGLGRFLPPRSLVGRLRENAYDEVYLLHRNPVAQLLVHSTRAPRRIGFDGGLGRLTMTRTCEFDETAHETDRYLNLLRITEPETPTPAMRIGFTESAEVTAELLLLDHAPAEPRIAIAPGGGRNPGAEMLFKRWPSARYDEVAARLASETGGSVVVFGTPDEATLCRRVAEAAGERGYSACGQTDLPQLAACLAKCQVMVANDSGPLHIAAAAGVPTVALFGPTDPRLVAPRGKLHRYLWRPPECGPCYRPDNSRGRKVWTCDRTDDELRCLRDITTDEVVRAAREALAGKPWPSDDPWSAEVSA